MAKDITLKSPNGEEIYYPKTVSDLVYDNETGRTLKEMVSSALITYPFDKSVVFGDKENDLSKLFIDIHIDKEKVDYSKFYYCFGVITTTAISLYLVSRDKKIIEEWGNTWFKKCFDFSFNNKEQKDDSVILRNGNSYIRLSKLPNNETTIYNLWGWAISPNCIYEAKNDILESSLEQLSNKVSTIEDSVSISYPFDNTVVFGESEKELSKYIVDININSECIDNTKFYYTIGRISSTSFSIYLVSRNKKVIEEWGNYIKFYDEFYVANTVEANGLFKICGNNDKKNTITLNNIDYFKNLNSGLLNLWNWCISPQCINKNEVDFDEINNSIDALIKTRKDVNAVIDKRINYDESTMAVDWGNVDEIKNLKVYSSSTFSGYKFSIGKVATPIRYIYFPYFCSDWLDNANRITEVAIKFYSYDGVNDTKIFEKKFSVLCDVGETSIFFEEIEELDLSKYDEVLMSVQFNSYGVMFVNNSLNGPQTTFKGQYSTAGRLTDSFSQISGYYRNIYFKLFNTASYTTMIKESAVNLSSVEVQKEFIDVSLPKTIYTFVGDTLQLFYRGIIKAVNPYNYNILVTCSKGNQYSRLYEYKPTANDIGTVPFKITVKDNNNNILGSASTNIVTVDSPKENKESINVACFGDSLTSSGVWCKTANEETPDYIKFYGSKINNTTGYFGVGGWTLNDYITSGRPAIRLQVSNVSSLSVNAVYTDGVNSFTVMEVNITDGVGNILLSRTSTNVVPSTNTLTKVSGNGDATITYSSLSVDSQNPLWDYENNKCTFIPYVNKYFDGKLDVVYTLLSWNGQSPYKTDFTSVISQFEKFYNTLHSEYPNAKLKIMGVQVPSVNGGMGANYGATGSGYADGYGMVVTALNMNKAYQDFANTHSDFVEFVNVSSQFDTEYNMPYQMKKVNTRSSITEMVGTNGVHPSNEGYMQIGDVVSRNIIANFCQ